MMRFILAAMLLASSAFADAPVIWNGTTAKWLPSGLRAAGMCQMSAAGVQSVYTTDGLIKMTSGVPGAATSGADFAPATSGSGYQKGNGSGGFTNQAAPIPLADGGTHANLSATGGTSQFLKQASVGADITVVRPACSDLSNAAASCSTDTTSASNISAGTLALARGGTNADLSATGGTSQFLKQASSGAAITVVRPACADLSNAAASCSTDTTSASNISAGTLGLARGGTNADLSATGGTSQFLKQATSGAAITVVRPACADLSNASASCSTDTTVASNISSGTLPAGRLPNPSASTLGGVQSYAAVSNQWINAISTSGVPSSAQPAFTNISGTATVAQTTVANQALTTCSTARTVDWSTGNSFTVTLTNANACAFTFSSQTSGQTITLDLYQPGTTGSATATWSSVLWAGGTAPTITTGASKHDKCTFQYNGTDTSGSCVQDLR